MRTVTYTICILYNSVIFCIENLILKNKITWLKQRVLMKYGQMRKQTEAVIAKTKLLTSSLT